MELRTLGYAHAADIGVVMPLTDSDAPILVELESAV